MTTTGGKDGAGGTGGTDAPGGMGGDPLACPSLATRAAQPFELLLGSPDQTLGVGGAGGAADLGDSACILSTGPASGSSVPLTCAGLARVTNTPNGPVLAFADGSELVWQLEGFDAGGLSEESVVHVQYIQEQYIICPFCGTEPRWSLYVTDAADPQRIFLSWSSTQRGTVTREAEETLGVAVDRRAVCSVGSTADCHMGVTTTYYDTLIGGSSSHLVAYGAAAEVTTENGSFVFYADQFAQNGTHERLCADGRGLAYGGTVLVIRR